MNTEHAQQNLPQMPPLGICTALLAGEVPALPASGEPPAWIKVTPRGAAKTRDGRNFSFTPETLAARFKADGIEVPADIEHSIALKSARGEAGEAIGWAKEVQARSDGTYARMEWLDKGKAALAARTHRYISPTFHHDEAGEATWLHSIALVAAPALSMPALAGTGLGAPPASSTIAEALGLEPGAGEAACLATIGEMRTAFVPVTLYADAIAALNTARSELSSYKGSVRTTEVQSLIEGALKAGKIVPAERDHYLALCSSEAGFQAVSLLMASKPPLHLFQPSRIGGLPRAEHGDEPAEALAARAGRYRHAQAEAGVSLSQTDAIAFCHANPAAGR